MKISRKLLDEYLQNCMAHYRNTPVMKYANEETREKLADFMNERFLPAWKIEVEKQMELDGVNELEESVVLEGIHSKLYLSEGFSNLEREIFKENDPAGFRQYLEVVASDIFY